MALTYYPMQDNYKTKLARAWDWATWTVYVNAAPEFTMPASSYTFITVDPWTTKEQVFICDSFNTTNKTLNAYSVTVNKWPWLAYTQQSHSVGAKVIISDAYAAWEYMKATIDAAIVWGFNSATLAQMIAWTDTYLWYDVLTQPSKVLTAIGYERNAGFIGNLTISASRTGSAETISLLTQAWTAPSATDPIKVAFRSVTAWTGDFTVLTLTSATTITIPSGATMWATNSVAFRLWLVWFNDWGTFRLWVVNCKTSTTIIDLSDDDLISSTILDTASDNAGVFYTGTAVTSKAYRILGYLDYSLAAVGTRWTAPSKIQLFWPWVKRPWQVVKTILNVTPWATSWTTVLPFDTSIPQNTEWDEYFSQAITPKAAANYLLIEANLDLTSSLWNNLALALFQDATAWALYAKWGSNAAATNIQWIVWKYWMVANTTSSTTFKVRAWGWSAWTTTLNSKYWLTNSSYLQITEFMV